MGVGLLGEPGWLAASGEEQGRGDGERRKEAIQCRPCSEQGNKIVACLPQNGTRARVFFFKTSFLILKRPTDENICAKSKKLMSVLFFQAKNDVTSFFSSKK